MITLNNISKTFASKDSTVHAVQNVTLSINRGEIFGIIGFSGAGKSTLVRCINLLETPNSGTITVDGVSLTTLSPSELRKERKKIGMIFQQFNLMASRTVFENVALPLKKLGADKLTIEKTVAELLELVELTDKTDYYPSQLSGGQKQRVAIARALVTNPSVLLCDEATSALDPKTTQNIISLLQKLNETRGITIVVITHEMDVVKNLCDRVAIMEKGCVKEVNSVAQIFANPQTEITKSFVQQSGNYKDSIELLLNNPDILDLNANQQLVKLDFFGSDTKEAIIAHLAQDYGIEASIVYGNVEWVQKTVIGTLVIVMSGRDVDAAFAYLKGRDINVEVINHVK